MEPSSKTIEFLLVCACPGMPQYAIEAFNTVFPGKIHPVMLVGHKQILDEANKHLEDKLGEVLKGISKNKENFCFYVKFDGENVELWDMRKGIRIP